MKYLSGITALIFYSLFANAQSQLFEKGYFVDVNNIKTECYIKIEEWNAVHRISYRLSRKDSGSTKQINEIREFGLNDQFKYIRVRTNVDISGDEVGLLSHEEGPEWQEENLFLRALVEGSINLYLFEVKGLKRYFFSDGPAAVEQLVFKKYRTTAGVQTNVTYQHTLFSRLNCMDSTERYFKSIKYNAIDLTRLFEIINKCEGATTIVYGIPQEPDVIETNGMQLTSVKRTISPQDKKKPTTLSNHYLGIVANQLLRQLFNFGGNNNSFSAPYLLQYAINAKKNGKGVNIGLTYDKNSFTDVSNGATRKTNNRIIAFRIGYDRKVDWGKRWIGIYGFDLLQDGSKSKTVSTPGFTIETSSKGWGIGPRFGILFRVSEKILLGTDAAYYFKVSKSSQHFPDQSRSTQKSTNFNLSLPVALFLTIKLKE